MITPDLTRLSLAVVAVTSAALIATVGFSDALVAADQLPATHFFVVRSVPAMTGGASESSSRVLQYGLTYRDVLELWRRCGDHVEVMVPARTVDATMRRLHRHTKVRLTGAYPDLSRFIPLKPQRGRFLGDPDVAELRNVVVLNRPAAAALLENEDSLGTALRIGADVYVLVGVVDDGSSIERRAWIPLTTMHSRMTSLDVQVVSGSFSEKEFDVTDLYVGSQSPQDRFRVLSQFRKFLAEGERDGKFRIELE